MSPVQCLHVFSVVKLQCCSTAEVAMTTFTPVNLAAMLSQCLFPSRYPLTHFVIQY